LGIGGLILALASAILLFTRRRKGRGEHRRSEWDVGNKISAVSLVLGTLLSAGGLGWNIYNSGRPPQAPKPAAFDESVVVEKRSSKPTEFAGHPIELKAPGAKFTFQNLAGVRKVMTYADWNTIVATSQVPELVKVAIDPDLNATATMARRTQYLADLVGIQDGRVTPTIVRYFINPADKKLVGFLFVVNGLSSRVSIDRLNVKVTDATTGTVLVDNSFNPAGQAVPAKTSYFTLVKFDIAISENLLSNVTTHYGIDYREGR